MVTAVVADDALLDAARERVALMLERSPQAYAAAKRLLWLAANVDLESGMVAEGLAQSLLIGTRRAQAGGRGGAATMIIELDGKTPQVAEDAFIAPTAVLIGDVTVAAGASIWFGAVLRGDNSAIVIGAGSNVQDNCVIHCADDLPTIVGENVTVGHMAMLEGCVIGDGSLIGMGAIVLQRAQVGAGSLVAAGAVVGEGVEIPAGVLAAGVPARVKKELAGESQRWVADAARSTRPSASSTGRSVSAGTGFSEAGVSGVDQCGAFSVAAVCEGSGGAPAGRRPVAGPSDARTSTQGRSCGGPRMCPAPRRLASVPGEVA